MRALDGTAVNASDISGHIKVILDVQPNDETVAAIDLTLGEHTISCRGVSSDQKLPVGLAESGQAEVECGFDTAAVTGECVGTQLMPTYANGDYALSAVVTTDEGETRTTLASQAVTLNNSDHIMIAHHAGKFMAHEGRNFHGGPTSDDNMNSFSACPVSYKGTMVGQLSLVGTHSAGGTALSFDSEDDDGKKIDGKTIEAPPFTWTLHSDYNGMVQNTDGNSYTVGIDGDILDDGDLLVTTQFSHEPAGPFQFDFKAPTATEVQVKKAAPTAGTMYSGHKDNVFTVAGATDNDGVGLDKAMTKVGVGSCDANKPEKAADRSKVAFVPIEGYENVKAIADLAEEDGTVDKMDDNGVNCYVAELTSLADKLGNAWAGNGDGKKAADWLQTANFGVDKSPPEIEDVEWDDDDKFNTYDAIAVGFEVQNPKLASGDAGTAVLASDASFTIADGKDADKDPDVIGTVTFNLKNDDDATATVTTLPGDGSYEATITVKDAATPPNMDTETVSFMYDATPPVFKGLTGTSGTVSGESTAIINVSGMIEDPTAGVKEATLTVRDNSNAPHFCEASDPMLDTLRVKPVEFKKKGAKVDISTTFTVKRQSTRNVADEALCVLLTATDEAGNDADTSAVTRVIVDWGGGVGGITVDTSNAGIVDDETDDHAVMVKLDVEPSAPVTVTITSSHDSVTIDDTHPHPDTVSNTLTFTPDTLNTVTNTREGGTWDDNQNFTFDVGVIPNDDDVAAEKATITITAEGGGYDITETYVISIRDPDWLLAVSPASLTEGDTADVTLTVTRSGIAAVTSNAATTGITVTGGATNTGAVTMTETDGTTAVTSPIDVTFAAGETTFTKTIKVSVADEASTSDGSVTFTLAGAPGRDLPIVGTDEGVVTVTVKNTSTSGGG